MTRVARFLSAYFRPPRGLDESEVSVPLGEGTIPATLLRPRTEREVPGWVVLHGLTVPGREHAALQRFARALAASGGAVLLPEIRAWCELKVAAGVAEETIAASARYLSHAGGVRGGGVGVIGFSFGATQALITAARTELDAQIRSVVGFGGYCDPERTFVFMMTGEHEWEGVRHHLRPDPYGRWILAGNYLADIPGYEGMAEVAAAALQLAGDAGKRGIYAADEVYDPEKLEIRARLTPDQQEIWDLIAPVAGAKRDLHRARELARALWRAGIRRDPGLDPRPVLPRLGGRIVLAHGREDRLIPFTETLRIRQLLPPTADVHTTITRLFAHSSEAEGLPVRRYPVEMLRYLRLLSQALR
jgi:pimeloyl-ACP methyl ester carboxylesterase